MVLLLIGLGVDCVIEMRNTHAFNKALDKGADPTKESIYVVPFSKKKDLLVVPPLWAYNRNTMYHRFKNGEMMTLVSLSGLHSLSAKPSKKQKEAFYQALKNGAEPNRNGVYILPNGADGTSSTIVVIPIRTQVEGELKTRYVSATPSEYYYWAMPQNDKLLALITDDGEVIHF